MMNLNDLINKIEKIKPKNKTLLIGIDGRGGSGKTTLALLIKKHFPQTHIITTDDFYNQKIEKIDEKLLEKQILVPISQNQSVTYKEFNGQVIKDRTIEPGGVLIIEGVYSIHSLVQKYYDLTIWIEINLTNAIKRVKTRDGFIDEKWAKYHRPNEDKYIKTDKPQKRADIVIENNIKDENI